MYDSMVNNILICFLFNFRVWIDIPTRKHSFGIRIHIGISRLDPDPDPGGQKDPKK